MTHDFTGKSIKCDTWEQMLHLAELAEEQGISKPPNDNYWFSEESFNDRYCYFILVDKVGYANDRIGDDRKHLPIVPYHTFINTLPTEVVEITGCGDCPFHAFRGESERNYCSIESKYETDKPLFTTCPLLTKSITIKLKQNDTPTEKRTICNT